MTELRQMILDAFGVKESELAILDAVDGPAKRKAKAEHDAYIAALPKRIAETEQRLREFWSQQTVETKERDD